jgi:hypothetical protein
MRGSATHYHGHSSREAFPRSNGSVILSETKDLNVRFFAVFTAQNDTPGKFRERF